jgi:hypothetical protein
MQADNTLGQAHSPASLPISAQRRLPDCFALPVRDDSDDSDGSGDSGDSGDHGDHGDHGDDGDHGVSQIDHPAAGGLGNGVLFPSLCESRHFQTKIR